VEDAKGVKQILRVPSSPDVARQHGFYAVEQDKDLILALIARLRH
jgi:hypothetical protein